MHLRHAPTRRRHDRTRGQSLVEFALVVPILLFLTVIALDFGRIYLGWVNLQSMTRIAANFAANNPDAWTSPIDAKKTEIQTQYQNQIRNDAVATNCRLPVVSGKPTAPAPVFTGTTIGATVTVGMSCTFDVITPGVSNILGGQITVSSEASFPVSTGMTEVGSDPPPEGTAPNAAFMGNLVQAPNTLSGTAPFTVSFRDTSGGNPTFWTWVFNDAGATSNLQDVTHTFANPGSYIVELTAENVLGSSTASMTVTVTAPTVADFTIAQANANAPSTVTFTDASAPGATAWAWSFGAGEGTGTGATTSHTYSTPGTYTVILTATYPTGPVEATKTVTVGTNLCFVPSLNGVRRNNAQSTWNNAGFSGTVSDLPGAPNGNYEIRQQSVTSSSWYPCNGNVGVSAPH